MDKALKMVKMSMDEKHQEGQQWTVTTGVYVLYNGINGKSFYQPIKLSGIHGAQFVRRTWPGKVTGFHALVEKQETVAFPQKSFDFFCFEILESQSFRLA